MTKTMRILNFLLLMVVGAGQAMAIAPSNPRVKFIYASEHGTAFASGADNDGKVTITITPDENWCCFDGDVTAKVTANTNMAQAPRRTQPGVQLGDAIDVTCTATNVFTLTLPEDENLNATVTIRFTEIGSLTVSNTLVSDLAADADVDFEFTVTLGNNPINGTYGDMTFDNGVATVQLKGGESAITSLPTGTTYTVTEAYAEGFELTDMNGVNGTISTTTSEATFTNTRETGDLEVSKTLVSDLMADADVEFTFTVTLGDNTISGTYGDMTFDNGVATVELKGGESAIATGLPTTVTYTVTETATDGFQLTGKTNDEGAISTTMSEATFTNTRETGNLKLSNIVYTENADDEFTFTVTLDDNYIGGTYGGMTFKDGVATVKLKGGESATATDLPTSLGYTVTKTDKAGYRLVEQTGYSGAISADNVAEAQFTYVQSTEVKVSAVWNDADNQDGYRPDDVTINLVADGNIIDTVVLSDENNWTYNWSGLDKYSNGQVIDYTVTENAVAEYNISITKNNEGSFTYTATNTHEPETIDVTVAVAWDDNNDNDDLRPEKVVVTLSDDSQVMLNENENWTGTVENRPKYAAGQKIEYTWTLGELQKGYELTDASVDGTTTTLTIGYNRVQLTYTLSATSTTYDGTNQFPSVSVKDGDTEIDDSEYDVTLKLGTDEVTECKNVGEYTVVISDKAKGNYYVEGSLTFTINPALVTVKADDKTKEWNDTPNADPELTVTITGVVDGESTDLISVTSISRAEGENSGEYTITPTGAAEQGNYLVTFETGTLTIVGKPVTLTVKNDKDEDVEVPAATGDATITLDQDGITLTLITPDENTEPLTVSIPQPVLVDHVEILRNFINGKAATLYLPFEMVVGNISGGTFHTFTSVDQTTTPWTVNYSEALDASFVLQANTPYIFLPNGSNGKMTVNNTAQVTVSTANPHTTAQGVWEFIGTHSPIVWQSGHADLGRVFGFAAEEKNGCEIGQFVKAGAGASIDPMRGFLRYTASLAPAMDGSNTTAVDELPATMRVVIGGETTSLSPVPSPSREGSSQGWYTLDGRKLDGMPTKKGIYINGGRKVVVR